MKRRDFIKTSIASAAVLSTPLQAEALHSKPVVKRYEEIGKTGLKMSDISYGCGRLPSSSMILRAIDRGINYFDTAPDYGSSEEYIGNAMNKVHREKIILATKFCKANPYPGHLPLGSKKDDYITALEGSLKRLKTDYVDFCFVHAIGEKHKDFEEEKKRLLDEELLSAVESLKKAGKMRFLAVSSHGPNNMETLLLAAIKSGHYSMIMPSFNFMKFPKMPDILKEAKKKGVGVIAMKTLAGAKDMKLDVGEGEFEPAAFKWVLKHGEVNGLVITIKKIEEFDLFLSASGEQLTAKDQHIMDRYANLYGKEYCRTGCNQCESACPEGIEIASVLRNQMYFKNYGMEKRAMQAYASLNKKAEPCATCTNTLCIGACPYNVEVRDMLVKAHDELSFNA